MQIWMQFEEKNSLDFGPQEEFSGDLDANCPQNKKELASKSAII